MTRTTSVIGNIGDGRDKPTFAHEMTLTVSRHRVTDENSNRHVGDVGNAAHGGNVPDELPCTALYTETER